MIIPTKSGCGHSNFKIKLEHNKLDSICRGNISGYWELSRAATVNRNIGYPRFRTHGSVSVRLFQISVRFRFVFF